MTSNGNNNIAIIDRVKGEIYDDWGKKKILGIIEINLTLKINLVNALIGSILIYATYN